MTRPTLYDAIVGIAWTLPIWAIVALLALVVHQ